MNAHHDLSPQAAAAEVRRTSDQIRRRSRWPAWMFLVLAAVNFAFFVTVGAGSHAVANALSPLPSLLVVVIVVIAARQPVIGHDARAINKPVVLACLATAVAGLVIDQTVLPHHFTWWLALLAAVMITPYLVGAACWFKR